MDKELHAKLEFEVEELNHEKIQTLKTSLTQLKGVSQVEFDHKTSKVYIETCLPSSVVHQEIEKNVRSLAVLRGMGSTLNISIKNLDTAVAEISSDETKPYNIKGVVRFVQLDDEHCAIDGTVDGLEKGEHAMHIFEYGDLSDGFQSLGNHYNPHNTKHGLPTDEERHVGDLGNIMADEKSRSTFRIIDKQVKLWDIIGRSICISEKPDLRHNNTGERLACGIIARSANIYANIKKVCLCSGKTLWDERRSFIDSQEPKTNN